MWAPWGQKYRILVLSFWVGYSVHEVYQEDCGGDQKAEIGLVINGRAVCPVRITVTDRLQMIQQWKPHIPNITWTVRSFSPVAEQPEGFYVSEEDDVLVYLAFWTEDSVWMLHMKQSWFIYSSVWRNIACQMLTEVIKTSLLPADAWHSLQRCLKPIFFLL